MTYKKFDQVHNGVQFLVNLNKIRLNYEIYSILAEFHDIQSPIWWCILFVWFFIL